MKSEIPLWVKFTLTIDEAVEYFHIGENKLRDIVNDYPDSGFVLRIGNKTLIKRQKFEQFIDEMDSL